MNKLLVIAAGGTGGHMFPAQALAEEMLARGWRVTLTSDARGMRYADGFPAAVARVELASASVSRGGLTQRLGAPVTILRGVAGAVARFRRDRPAMVAGFGGYPTVPALGAAWWLGVPRLIHEQNGVLGRVNRLFARRVNRVVCGTWPTHRVPRGAEAVHLGNPVRQSVAAAAAPYEPPGDGPVELVVFGGSQGASALSRMVPGAVSLLPEDLRRRLRVTQQVRQGEEVAVHAGFHGASVDSETAAFFTDMPARIAGAQLVIARAGAGTVAELAAIGRPAILIPLPAAMDDHQSVNAAALADAGGAILAPEAGLTTETLAGHIRAVLLDPAKAAAMAEAAKDHAKPKATEDLADLVESLATSATKGR